MGLEIGFNIYKKEKDDKGKLTLKKVDFPEGREDDSWSCGRCDVNNSWAYGYSEKPEKITRVTFDQDLDNYEFPLSKKEEEEGYSHISLGYMPYKEFKKNVMDAINEAFKEGEGTKKYLSSMIFENIKTIKELRDLQMKCTSSNEFAFYKWSEEIEKLKEENRDFQSDIDNYDNENYDMIHAIKLKKILQYLERCQEEGYTCIPWYSC